MTETDQSAVRVLLVEDSAVIRMMAVALLKKHGFEVKTASSGEEALEAFSPGSHHLVLMDIELPGINGLETTRAIRQAESKHPEVGQAAYIVATTAHDSEEHRGEYLGAGMDDVARKPLQSEKLAEILEILETRKAQPEEKEEATPTAKEYRVRHVLVFRLGEERYGLDLCYLKKVMWAVGITPVPDVPPHILGIVPVRGEIVSVVDLKELLGLGASLPEGASLDELSIVVTTAGGVDAGFLVDDVEDVLELPEISIDPPMATFEKESRDFIEGQTRVGGKLMAILNYEKILASEKMEAGE